MSGMKLTNILGALQRIPSHLVPKIFQILLRLLKLRRELLFVLSPAVM
jgi:hypothetical protein